MRVQASIQARVLALVFTLIGVRDANAEGEVASTTPPAPTPVASTTPPAPAASSSTPPAADTPPVAVTPAVAVATPPAVTVAATPVAAPAAAKPHAPTPITPESRAQARQRFNRGLELYDAGDFGGALREFQGALDVMRHPIVLYNVALVYAQLGLPVECTKTVEELEQGGAQQLDPASRENLSRIHQEQRGRIGRLRIRANVPGAVIQVDGLDLGQNSIDNLPIVAGEHIVSTVASGYIPRRMRVFVPAQAEQEVSFTLQPLQSTLAHLHVVTDVPDVEVLVDDESVGKTPFPASLAFAPGPHTVTLRRPGYVEQKQSVALDPGGEGHLKFEMLRDASANAPLGVLALDISEPNSMVSINGRALGIGQPRFQLPVGRHRLLVHSAGFMDYERDVVVQPGETPTRVDLMPTSEFLKKYEADAGTQRTLGWVGLGTGLVLAAGGTGFVIWNEGEARTADREFDAFVAQVREDSPRGCMSNACLATASALSEDADNIHMRSVYGWIGVGVGSALSLAGAAVLIWGNDPERYAPSNESDVFGSLRFDVRASTLGGTAALSGTF